MQLRRNLIKKMEMVSKEEPMQKNTLPAGLTADQFIAAMERLRIATRIFITANTSAWWAYLKPSMPLWPK